MRYTKLFLLFLLIFSIKQPVFAETEQNSAFIRHFVEDFLIEQFPSTDDERMEVTVAELDPRIIIPPCEVPLKAELTDKDNTRNINVKVSCDDSSQWNTYISAKVEITEAILIAKNTINRGEQLDSSNVELAYIGVNRLRGEKLTDSSEVFGAKAVRRISRGKPINKNSICIVCKGDVVTILVSSSTFSIKTKGVALSSGNINDQIRVQNTRSNKIITPRVKAINQVIIHL